MVSNDIFLLNQTNLIVRLVFYDVPSKRMFGNDELEINVKFNKFSLSSRLWEIKITQIPFSYKSPSGCMQYHTGVEGRQMFVIISLMTFPFYLSSLFASSFLDKNGTDFFHPFIETHETCEKYMSTFIHFSLFSSLS